MCEAKSDEFRVRFRAISSGTVRCSTDELKRVDGSMKRDVASEPSTSASISGFSKRTLQNRIAAMTDRERQESEMTDRERQGSEKKCVFVSPAASPTTQKAQATLHAA